MGPRYFIAPFDILQPSTHLGGTRTKTATNQYKAKDGFYYNGYMLSPDCAEDAFDPAFKKMSESIELELFWDEVYTGHGCGD